MAIKKYQTVQEYNNNSKSINESDISLITQGNEVMVDGVNVLTNEPTVGDAAYKDADGNVHYIVAKTYVKSLIPDDWTYKGPVIARVGDNAAVLHGNLSSFPNLKWANKPKFSITAITATTIKFWLKMAGDYANFVGIEVELTSAEINATSASEISAALDAAGNTDNVGYSKHKYWAYLADADGNKVESGGTQIIVQCDSWLDYRQYQCNDSTHALVGCTMAFSTWGDMPASDSYFKVNGKTSNTRGLQNFEGGAVYWGTHGRTLNANVAVDSEAGNADPMKLTEFQTSAYAAEVRAYYKTYKNYLRGEFGIMLPQKKGAFSLPDGKVMTEKYGPKMSPTKDGTMEPDFPSLNYCYNLGDGIFMCDVTLGTLLMEDENLALINRTQTLAGKATISNATYRWWAERYNTNYAWLFGGYNRYLYSSNVSYSIQVVAVTLLPINN